MARSLCPNGGNDKVYTPNSLTISIVNHFQPRGEVLEPCRGKGAFMYALALSGIKADWCELDEGRDFLTHDFAGKHFDWIVTNPPWSFLRPFLRRSMELSDNVVFLCLVNAFFMKARLRDMREAGFGFKEIVFVDTPSKETGWPQTGFALGAVHIQRGYNGQVTFSSI